MNIILKFKNINDCNGVPLLKIGINNQTIYNAAVKQIIILDHDVQDEHIHFTIEHYGKDPSKDTLVDKNNTILQDKNCELETIIIDDYDLEELKWESYYLTCDNERIDQCLFFGKNGTFNLEFLNPVLKWILQTRHNKLNNDPDWQEDYESYIRACKLLNKLN